MRPPLSTLSTERPLPSTAPGVSRFSIEDVLLSGQFLIGDASLAERAEALVWGGPFMPLTIERGPERSYVHLPQGLVFSLADTEPLPAPVAFAIGLRLAEALDQVHNNQAVHGHLHQDSVGFDLSGRLRIAPALHHPLTHEQGHKATPADDCLALGHMIAHMLGWSPPAWSELPLEGVHAKSASTILRGLLRERVRLRLSPARALRQTLASLFVRSQIADPDAPLRAWLSEQGLPQAKLDSPGKVVLPLAMVDGIRPQRQVPEVTSDPKESGLWAQPTPEPNPGYLANAQAPNLSATATAKLSPSEDDKQAQENFVHLNKEKTTVVLPNDEPARVFVGAGSSAEDVLILELDEAGTEEENGSSLALDEWEDDENEDEDSEAEEYEEYEEYEEDEEDEEDEEYEEDEEDEENEATHIKVGLIEAEETVRVEAMRLADEDRRIKAEEAQLEAERIEAERIEAERIDAEEAQLKAVRIEAEAAAAEHIEAEEAASERIEAEEAERIEAERIEAERIEAERIEAERIEAERIEAERIEAERIEAERIEAERIKAREAQLEAERIEAERIEAERIEAERIEAERIEAERIEAERIEAERIEAARIEAARIEAARIEAARIEAERIEAEEAARTQAKSLAADPADAVAAWRAEESDDRGKQAPRPQDSQAVNKPQAPAPGALSSEAHPRIDLPPVAIETVLQKAQPPQGHEQAGDVPTPPESILERDLGQSPAWGDAELGVGRNAQREEELGDGKWNESGRSAKEIAGQLPSSPVREMEFKGQDSGGRALLMGLVVGTVLLLGTLWFLTGAKSTASITLETHPAGLRISVDGKDLGKAPAKFNLPSGQGQHRLCAYVGEDQRCKNQSRAQLRASKPAMVDFSKE